MWIDPVLARKMKPPLLLRKSGRLSKAQSEDNRERNEKPKYEKLD